MSILISKVIAHRLRLFLNFWNFCDLILAILTLVLIFLYFYRWTYVNELIGKIQNSKSNVFVSFASVTFFSKIVTITSSLLICLAIVRLCKYFTFSVSFQVMTDTIMEIRWSALNIAVIHVITLLAFMFCGHILFGTQHEGFKDFSTSFVTLILLSLNLFFFDVAEVFSDTLSCCYFSLYAIFVLVIYTVYIAVIVIHYSSSKQKLSSVRKLYTVQEYFRDKYIYWKEFLKVRFKNRLRGGHNVEVIYSKSFEHRYADCLKITSKFPGGVFFLY